MMSACYLCGACACRGDLLSVFGFGFGGGGRRWAGGTVSSWACARPFSAPCDSIVVGFPRVHKEVQFGATPQRPAMCKGIPSLSLVARATQEPSTCPEACLLSFSTEAQAIEGARGPVSGEDTFRCWRNGMSIV